MSGSQPGGRWRAKNKDGSRKRRWSGLLGWSCDGLGRCCSALGYLVLPLSGFLAWAQLGVLTALMMAVSALATLTIIPAVIMTMRPKMFAISPEYVSAAARFEMKRAASG